MVQLQRGGIIKHTFAVLRKKILRELCNVGIGKTTRKFEQAVKYFFAVYRCGSND